ncbi:unnamed protein product [Fusarium equiseti]|uniref:Ankyrin n=1 Tax=Fusarium equiseti TaxID=61235 RepID=A0A8J2IRJ5_FUSEQ|nr:unnamed protein product [Fusarium equiseti]
MTDLLSTQGFFTKAMSAEELDLLNQLVDAGKSGDADQFKSIANMFEELNTDGVGSIILTRALTYNWDSAIVKILVDFPREFFDWTIGSDLPGSLNMPGPLNRAATDETLDIFLAIAESRKLPLTFSDPQDWSRTPLHAACRSGALNVFEYLYKQDEVHDMIDSKDDLGRTPLSYAAEFGHDKICHHLLNSTRVYFDTKDNERRAPREYARLGGHSKIGKMLSFALYHEQMEKPYLGPLSLSDHWEIGL